MHSPTQSDIRRIYRGFNEADAGESGRYDFLGSRQSCDNENGVRLELDRSVALGYWELFRLNRGLLVCITDGLYLSQYHQDILPRQDLISLRFILSGGLRCSYDRMGDVAIPKASACASFTHSNQAFDLSIDSGSHLCSVTFHIKPELLITGFGINPDKMPTPLSRILTGADSDSNLYSQPLSPAMLNNVLDMVNMPYSGARRRLFTEAKTAELICRFFEEVEQLQSGSSPRIAPRSPVKESVFKARKILLETYKSPPTVTELARQVGLSRSLLSNEFKATFGRTISEYTLACRMNTARDYLQGTNKSVAQIAEAVGYDHPTNFTSAFKKFFGCLPKALRRSRPLVSRK